MSGFDNAEHHEHRVLLTLYDCTPRNLNNHKAQQAKACKDQTSTTTTDNKKPDSDTSDKKTLPSWIDLQMDYRVVQCQRLCDNLHIPPSNQIFFDVSEFTAESAKQIVFNQIASFNQALSTSAESLTIYVAMFSYDLRLLYRLVDQLAAQLPGMYQHSTEMINIVVLEDILYVDRPYIFEQKHNNFFKNLSTVADKHDHVDVTLQSTNVLINRWAENDTYIAAIPIFNEKKEGYWHRILEEINFHEMYNQGNMVPRLISIQSIANAEGGRPLYRHPNDEEPPNVEMIPLVRELLQHVEAATGITGINHVLIQHYRHGRDNIAQHSDKTLDIDPKTPIINVSFGCPRWMYLQNKTDRNRLERIGLQHGECVVFGLKSNQFWFHEVPKDVTMPADELFGTSRVSFTFRKIATFVYPKDIVHVDNKDADDRPQEWIVGQGSPFKTIEAVRQYLAQQPPSDDALFQQTRMDLIHAFSQENRQAGTFNWQDAYGRGFLIR